MSNQYSNKTPEQRVEAFWNRVDKSGGPDACWLWVIHTAHGYGQMYWRGRARQAHRISWELSNGPIPEGLHVLHNCPGGDNPRCVNPAHLWLGTNQDNMNDRVLKGQNANQIGERNPACKLTDAQVAEIRRRFAEGGVLQRELAVEYGVSRSNVGYIVKRKSRA